MSTREFVKFRLIAMPYCGHHLCWVNPRLPNFCPECGASVLAQIRMHPESILFSDEGAQLRYSVTLRPIELKGGTQ